MPVLPRKNPRCPNFGVGMPHARSGGDALIHHILSSPSQVKLVSNSKSHIFTIVINVFILSSMVPLLPW